MRDGQTSEVRPGVTHLFRVQAVNPTQINARAEDLWDATIEQVMLGLCTEAVESVYKDDGSPRK